MIIPNPDRPVISVAGYTSGMKQSSIAILMLSPYLRQ